MLPDVPLEALAHLQRLTLWDADPHDLLPAPELLRQLTALRLCLQAIPGATTVARTGICFLMGRPYFCISRWPPLTQLQQRLLPLFLHGRASAGA